MTETSRLEFSLTVVHMQQYWSKDWLKLQEGIGIDLGLKAPAAPKEDSRAKDILKFYNYLNLKCL